MASCPDIQRRGHGLGLDPAPPPRVQVMASSSGFGRVAQSAKDQKSAVSEGALNQAVRGSAGACWRPRREGGTRSVMTVTGKRAESVAQQAARRGRGERAPTGDGFDMRSEAWNSTKISPRLPRKPQKVFGPSKMSPATRDAAYATSPSSGSSGFRTENWATWSGSVQRPSKHGWVTDSDRV